jgi:hypothetical protein
MAPKHRPVGAALAQPVLAPTSRPWLAPLTRPEMAPHTRPELMMENIADLTSAEQPSTLRPDSSGISLAPYLLQQQPAFGQSETAPISASVDGPNQAAATSTNITPLITTLDPTLPPFTPLPGPSMESQPRAGRGKAKSNPGVATTKEDIAHEFSKIELNTIRARLKVLESKNKDLEFQNSILLERVSVFEKS